MKKKIIRVFRMIRRTKATQAPSPRPEYIRRLACDVLKVENEALLNRVEIYYTTHLISRRYREIAEVLGGFQLYRDANDLNGVFCPWDGVLTLRKRPALVVAPVVAREAA